MFGSDDEIGQNVAEETLGFEDETVVFGDFTSRVNV